MKQIKLFRYPLTSYSLQDELEEEVNQFLRELHGAGVKNITVSITSHSVKSGDFDDLDGEAVILVTWDEHD
jgi:hypothetical protein